MEVAQPSKAHSSGSPAEAVFWFAWKNGHPLFASAAFSPWSPSSTTKLTWHLPGQRCFTAVPPSSQKHPAPPQQQAEGPSSQVLCRTLLRDFCNSSGTSLPWACRYILIHWLSETILFHVSPKDYWILIKKGQGQLFPFNIKRMTWGKKYSSPSTRTFISTWKIKLPEVMEGLGQGIHRNFSMQIKS